MNDTESILTAPKLIYDCSLPCVKQLVKALELSLSPLYLITLQKGNIYTCKDNRSPNKDVYTVVASWGHRYLNKNMGHVSNEAIYRPSANILTIDVFVFRPGYISLIGIPDKTNMVFYRRSREVDEALRAYGLLNESLYLNFTQSTINKIPFIHKDKEVRKGYAFKWPLKLCNLNKT